MALVDLKRDKQEKAEVAQEMAVGPSGDDYPYGTCLHLENDEIEKIGIPKGSKVGDEFHIRAVGRVTRVSSSEDEGQDEQSGMDVQITMIEMRPEIEAGRMEDIGGEAGEAAEARATGARTVLGSTYRGRKA